MNLEQRFQCINECPNFITVGIPRRCPHCGSKELQLCDSDESYEQYRTKYINEQTL